MQNLLKTALKSVGVNRERVVKVRMAAERNALAQFGRRYEHSPGRILCYHSLGQHELGLNDVTPQRFERHIELAQLWGYRFVPALTIARGEAGPKDLAITFDDAWRSVGSAGVDILARHGIPWSIFVVSGWPEADWVRDRVLSWDELARLRDLGVDIGSHSVSHPDFGKLDRDRTREELYESRNTFEKRLGFAPTSFAIPLGQSKNWTDFAMTAAREAGYEIVYAQAEQTRPPGTVPRTFVTAFDHDRIFRALLKGAFDRWEEWS